MKNKKIKFGVGVAIIIIAAGSGYLLVRAYSVSDDFSTSALVAATWHTTVDTSAGVAKLATRSCNSDNYFCGTGYNNVCANLLGDGDYVVVAKADYGAPTTQQWKTAQTNCDRPQCGINGAQEGDNLQADNTINYNGYQARDDCKAIGGRLPTVGELQCIFTNKTTFGNNYQPSNYWSATEYTTTDAWLVNLSTGTTDASYGKNAANYVRCVQGW